MLEEAQQFALGHSGEAGWPVLVEYFLYQSLMTLQLI